MPRPNARKRAVKTGRNEPSSTWRRKEFWQRPETGLGDAGRPRNYKTASTQISHAIGP